MNKKFFKKIIKQNEKIIDLLSDISKKQNKNFAELTKKIDSTTEQPEKELKQAMDILETVEKRQRQNLKEILGKISDVTTKEEPRNQRRQHTYYSNDNDFSED